MHSSWETELKEVIVGKNKKRELKNILDSTKKTTEKSLAPKNLRNITFYRVNAMGNIENCQNSMMQTRI